MRRKFLTGAVVGDASLGARQIRVIANSGKPDRVGDVLVAAGCDLTRYNANPIVLATHDPEHPIGNARVYVAGSQLEALITFAPAGASRKADEFCALAKAGVIGAVSAGFAPIETKPLSDGGMLFNRWELLELSLVAVPCDPGAVVIERALGKTGRVLSNANAELLAGIAKCLTKSQEAHDDAMDSLAAADAHRRRAIRQAGRIAANAERDDDALSDPDDSDSDVELAAAAARRKRIVEIEALAFDFEADRRRREIEIADLAALF